MVLWTLVYRYLFKSLLSVLLDRVSEVKLISHMVILCLTFWETTLLFSKCWTTLHPHQLCTKVPFSTSLEHIVFPCCCFFFHNKSHPNGLEVISLVVLISISLINDVVHHFLLLLGIYVFSLEKCLFNWVDLLFLSGRSSLYILSIDLLSVILSVYIFPILWVAFSHCVLW